MTHVNAAKLFDRDAHYHVSANALVQFDRDTYQPLLSSSAVLDHYGWRARLAPDRIVDLNYADPAFWNFYNPAVYRLTAPQFRTFTEFLEPATPREVWQRQAATESDESSFEELLAMLVYLRILIQHPLDQPHSGEEPVGTRGVLVIAAGEKYIRMACSLAESIKAGSPDLPIALIHCAGEAAVVRKLEAGRALFQCLIEQDRRDFFIRGKFSANLLKISVDRLTPFDETLAIDADSLIFPSRTLAREFDRYRDIEFAPVCSGVFEPGMDPDILCTPSTTLRMLRDQLEVAGPVYRMHSYFMFFRRTESMAQYFAKARDLMHAAAQSPDYPWRVTDEPMLSATSSLIPARIYSGYYMPVADKAFLGGDVNPISLQEQFLGLTMIGSPPPGYIRVYNSVVAEAARMRGNREPYFWQGKS